MRNHHSLNLQSQKPAAGFLTPGVVLTLLLAACGGSPPPEPVAIRLIDVFTPDVVEGTPANLAPSPPRSEWRFTGNPPTGGSHATRFGWEAGPGVTGLTVRDGLLVGRTTTDFPILHVERTGDLGGQDSLHAIEIRLRVSAGANLAVDTRPGATVDLKTAATPGPLSWLMTSPLRPGEEPQTYIVTPPTRVPASSVRHILVRPTDAAGATFAIESVRAITRMEHLASVASGIGWQGLSEIYHESLVARAPETLRFSLQLPDRPWLDLALGTPEDGPVTFRVGVTAGGAAEETVVLDQTVSTPHRWERRRLDLSAYAGEAVTVSLALAADKPGALGFWGSPVVRNRSPVPPATTQAAGSDRSRSGFEARPQGVILIQADTLRPDHLDAYGYERATAPTLRRMAEEGALFRNAFAQATWTKVSTPSILTSLHPLSHGVRNFADRLPVAATTLAEVFRDAGYATLSLSSIPFTGQFTNLHQGFEELHESGFAFGPGSSKTAREYVDRVIEWLDEHRDVPFFVYLHVFDPHDPYEPYRPYDTMWTDAAEREQHVQNLDQVRKFIEEPILRQFGMPTRQELEKAGLDPQKYVEHDEGWYDGSIRALDVEMHRLLERLRGLGLDEQTLVVFLSDHGEEFLEHGRMFHGQTVYGELARVPLIARWPGGVSPGTVVTETVQLIDVMPTVLELSGLPMPEGVQGQSFVPLLLGAPAATDGSGTSGWTSRPAFTERALSTDDLGVPPRNTESYGIVDQGWKLVHNVTRAKDQPEFELYEMEKDPFDRVDVAAQHPDIVERLAKELERWRRLAENARLPADAQTTDSLSKEQLERLRSLGYIR